MKLIHKFKSPNYNERKTDEIKLIIIHYTALKSISESIIHLTSKKNKVSTHYIISKNGQIYNLVSEKKRAWHAGKSYWQGKIDINSNSIGIELDYFPTEINNRYNNKLIYSLIKLLKQLIKKYKIKPVNILGHSDIAPYRKIDPGKNFPWYLLEEEKISFKIQPLKEKKNIFNFLNKWFKINKFTSKKKKILFMLNYIGYDTSLALNTNIHFKQLILIYSNRYRFYRNMKYNKKEIFNIIQLHFLNILLTNLKK